MERMERERRWQAREERRKKRGDRIALTPTLEKIGIKFVQPNMDVIESMDRLIAVPSEKFRVWSCWLSMVADEVHEWRYWLLSQINLVLRMSDIMLKTEAKGKEIKKKDNPKVKDEEGNYETVEKKVKTMDHTTEINDGHQIDIQLESEKEEEAEKQGEAEEQEEEEKVPERKDPELAKVDGEIEEETLGDTHVLEELSPDTEPTSDANPVVVDREEEIDTDEGSNGKATDEIEKEGKADSHKGEENKEKENAWPIGLPWEPKESDKKEKREKEMLEKVKIIPIPRNEEEMMKLIVEVRHTATIYRSFYRHWIETGDRAKSELMNRDIMKTDAVHTHEEIPYFFYLKCEPDIDIGIEHDDEQILLPDLTRERISSNYINLFFNLADNPGKGGNPWI